jgi:hypothetical protein
VDRYERTRGSTRAGRYSEEVLRNQETNSDFILTMNKNFNNLSLIVQAGGIQRKNYYKMDFARVEQLTIDRLYNLGSRIAGEQPVRLCHHRL